MVSIKAKPFLKWAGGKTQLLPTLESFLPVELQSKKTVTYIEPFIGGGAMLFSVLQKYSNIKKAVICDINIHLIKAYVAVRNAPQELIGFLANIQCRYYALTKEEDRKDFYLNIRDKFNNGNLSDIEEAAYLIFLNRTCFNGLYRENSKGSFNVPFGRYSNPTICDDNLILSDSSVLQKVDIIHDDFSNTESFVDGYTFVYCDPPYRPLNATSNFNSYVKVAFNDDEQVRLKMFVDKLSANGCHVMLSNSDSRMGDENRDFFDELYREYIIERVFAKRCINANPKKRGALTELLIRNYKDCIG